MTRPITTYSATGIHTMHIQDYRNTVTPRVIGQAPARQPAFAGLSREEIAARVAADRRTARARIMARDGASRWTFESGAKKESHVRVNAKYLAAISEKPTTAAELAEAFLITRTTANEAMRQMVIAGYASKVGEQRSPVICTITDAGREYLAGCRKAEAAL